MADEMNFAAEFPEGAEMNAEVPATEAEAKTNQTYTLKDGSQGSRAAFIREKFLEDNMSRKDIADEFGFPYRVVYSATVNMTNEAEAPQRGRTAANATIKVDENNAVITEVDGKTLVNGEEGEPVGELKEISRNEWIRQQVEAGVGRGDIAKALNMSYGVIYGITKDQEGTRSRVEIELEDGTKVSRAEYIRMQFSNGVSRGDIAKELNVPYSVVWQATKTEKTAADHFAELIEDIKSFEGKVENADVLAQAIELLNGVIVKTAEEPAEATEGAEDETPAEEIVEEKPSKGKGKKGKKSE